MIKINSTLICLIAAFLLWNCSSSSEDPTPEDDFSFGFVNNENLIDGTSFVKVPDAMAGVSNQCASLVQVYVAASNTYLFYSGYFLIPTAGERSNTVIEAVPGHSNYSTREWTDGFGEEIAFQLSEGSGTRVFKIFIRESGGEYQKFIEATENSDGVSGTMDVFEIDNSSTVEELSFSYIWKINSDDSREVTYQDYNDEQFKVTVKNNSNLSGEVEVMENGIKTWDADWDELGNGSWRNFDTSGAILDEGTWTI